MRKSIRVLMIAAIVLGAAIFSFVLFSTPKVPTENLTWVDPPDILEDESDYVISTATATVPMNPQELRNFLKSNRSLIAFMEPVGSIAPPVERIAIEGEWPEQGARRLLIQVDGHQLLERSLKNETTDFQYQAFAFTGSAARGVDHIYGSWTLTPVEEGTHFEWTYRVAPKNGFTRIFVKRTRDKELRPFMQGAVDRMAEAVRAYKAQSN